MRIDAVHELISGRHRLPATGLGLDRSRPPRGDAWVALRLKGVGCHDYSLSPEEQTLLLLAAAKGGVTVSVLGETHSVKAGQWALFDGRVPVDLSLAARTELLAVRYDRALLHADGTSDHCSVMECLVCPNREETCLSTGRVDGRLRGCLSFLAEAAAASVSASLLHRAKCLESLAVVLALSDANACSRKRECCSANTCCLQEAAGLLETNLAEDHSIRSLAQTVGTNEYTLKQGFRQLYQTTVFGYLREKRMDRARELFERGQRSVTETAVEVGYTNTSHFAAAFRRQFGVNPKAFIKQLERS